LRAEGEAIQSAAPHLDCFVASRLAMTAEARRRFDHPTAIIDKQARSTI
jgi:hypothetical protein